MKEREKKRMWPSGVVRVVCAALGLGLLGLPSLRKYADYERPTGVPRLRESIGKRVHVPQQALVAVGKVINCGPYTGVLRYVGYRFSDKLGFFDCEIGLEKEREGDTSVGTGLSPEEVRQVKVMDEPKPPDGADAEDRAAQP